MQVLSDEQVKKMNREIVSWVRKVLKEKHGVHVYNILLQLKHWTEEIERDEK